jgi:GNAT superfamily N-acetyltransferase
MTTVIHRAGPDDLEVVVALVQEFYEVDHHTFDRDRVVGALRPLLADDVLGQVWLVDDPERRVEPGGYAVLTWGWSLESGGRECLLDEMYVRSPGEGLGTKVLIELIEKASAAGAAAMFLETEAHNHRARVFYGKADFALEDSVWMSLKLDPPVEGSPGS